MIDKDILQIFPGFNGANGRPASFHGEGTDGARAIARKQRDLRAVRKSDVQTKQAL